MPRSALTLFTLRDVASATRHAHADAPGLYPLSTFEGLPEPGLDEAASRSRPRLNFAAQDYLALGHHPAVRAGALAALGRHREPGSLQSSGLCGAVLDLEARVAQFVQLPNAVAFSSGSEAIRATLGSLLRAGDDVIVDAGAHPAMFETVRAMRARLHRSPAGSVEAVERRLRRLAAQPRRGRLYLAAPAISAHDSKLAAIAELLELARLHGAVLIVDVTHDLGSMGQAGGGVMEIQGCLGRVNVVLGSFAKSFGATGGFAAFQDPALKTALCESQWRSAALSPVNAGAILAALDLVDGPEGRRRRRVLHGSALRLRNHLMADGLPVMGQASPLVPVRLPMSTAVARTALLESAGPLVTLLRAPIVAAHAPRWRIQLNSDHGPADIDDLAELIRDVTRAFSQQARTVRIDAPLPQT